MKKQKEKKEEYEIKWWKDWLEADILKREEMVNNLPIVRTVWDLSVLSEDMKKRAFAQTLNGMFEDLKNAVYTKIHNEGEE